MKIEGKTLADTILQALALKVSLLKDTPTLAVILVGDNPASLAYIKQKQNAAKTIGAKIIFNHQQTEISIATLKEFVDEYNNDPSIHGLIIQRPLPSAMGDATPVLNAVSPKKDVDGFVPNSPFDVPVASAVGEILKHVHSQEKNKNKFLPWVKQKNIVVVGRGETAGAPIASYLQKLECATSVIHSQTPNPKELMKKADIIISCVGKSRVVRREAIKPGVILISVGIWRDGEGKLHGDYEEAEIASIASFYTPTPGGVGPVNVACLMKNLLQAAGV
jgi:methylenetetrahydrofolate dehydrogenase (NADP+)/methenyltetrahydrofolate cyclohydrolase